MERRTDSRRLLVGLAVGVPVSLVFGLLAFRNTEPDEIGDALRGADALQLAAAVALFGLMYGLQALRWRTVAGTEGVGFRTFLGLVVGGIAVNNVLPGRIGDLLRGRWLGREATIGSGRALATVVLDRTGDVVALTFLLAVSVTRTDVPRWLRGVGVGAAAAVVVALGTVLLARGYSRRRPRGRHDRGRVRALARDVLDGLARPLGGRRIALALVLSLASWLVFATAAMLVGRSVGVDLSLSDATLVASVVNLGVAIPSSPGFVGTYQWLVVESVALVAVASREQALAVAILLHAAWYVPTTVIGGVVTLRRIGRRPAARGGHRSTP